MVIDICASIRPKFLCSTKKSRAFTTEGTEDHRGNQRKINADLFDELHWSRASKNFLR